MASSLSVNKILSSMKITQYDFDPDAATATAAGWVAMKNFGQLAVSFFRTVGTGDITLTINGATDASGSNSTIIVTKTLTYQPDAVGNYVFLECLAEQINSVGKAAGYDFTHASAVITFETGTDEGVVTYIQGAPRFAYDGLTADLTS